MTRDDVYRLAARLGGTALLPDGTIVVVRDATADALVYTRSPSWAAADAGPRALMRVVPTDAWRRLPPEDESQYLARQVARHERGIGSWRWPLRAEVEEV